MTRNDMTAAAGLKVGAGSIAHGRDHQLRPVHDVGSYLFVTEWCIEEVRPDLSIATCACRADISTEHDAPDCDGSLRMKESAPIRTG